MNRRSFLHATTGVFVACSLPPRAQMRSTPSPPRPSPSPSQLAWQRDELALFLHFGVNTFTDREWGDGHEDPSIFSPSALDARQWARAARNAGARALILTAKHNDGFCLWPTRTTGHSVAASPWRSGGDRVQLQQFLMNLTLNGIDAMKETTDAVKELTITSEAGQTELVVSVSDTGTGVEPQHADRIFDAFYTTKPHGTGMGLAISRSIVESHGGRLWVTSNPGAGANFHLTLPIQSETAQGVN